MTDPTNSIDTLQRAKALAHAMLRLAPAQAPEPWRSRSEPILAMLLYTASPGQAGGGVAGVHAAATALAARSGDAVAPAGIPDAHTTVLLGGLNGLREGERAALLDALRGAVTPWLSSAGQLPGAQHADARHP